MVLNMKRRRTWLTGLLVFILGCAIIVNQHPGKLAHIPEEGYLAPGFTLETVQGQSLNITQLKGKPLMINFFASWCPPCQAEAPDLVKMDALYHSQVTFIGVDMTESDSRSAVIAFMKKVGIHYPVLLDSVGKVAKEYDVISIPTSFFINSKGVIVDRVEGALSQRTLQAELSQLVKISSESKASQQR